MPAVIVKYKSKKALKALQEVATAFDMVIEQTVADAALANAEKYAHLPITFSKDPDVTALAGIWKDKAVTLEELRKEAWGDRI